MLVNKRETFHLKQFNMTQVGLKLFNNKSFRNIFSVADFVGQQS